MEVEEETTIDSAADSTDTPADTEGADSHKSDEVDVDTLVKTLERHADKIPTDRLNFLDRKFQPEFTRRLNALDLLKKNTDASTRKAMTDAGITVPEDVSIFKDDGKPFLEAILQTVRKEAAPIREQMEIGKRNEEIRGYMAVAQEIYPEVKEEYKAALELVDKDPQLLALAHAYDGKAVPLVLKGAAIAVKLDKATKRIAELEDEVRRVKVGKIGPSTTKTGGKVVHSDNKKSLDLRSVVAQSLAAIQAEGEKTS